MKDKIRGKNEKKNAIFAKRVLELSCCKKWQKSPNQETGLGNGNV